MTLVNAAMLVGVVLILTWRSNQAQQELRRLVTTEGVAIERLGKVATLHASFRAQWIAAAARGPEAVASAGRSYGSIRQLAVSPGSDARSAQIGDLANGLAAELRNAVRSWPEWDDAGRRAKATAITVQCERITRQAAIARDAALRERDAKLETISHDPRNTLAIAFGIAWIVAVMSMAGAVTAMRRIVSPLENLSRAAQRIAAGEYAARAPVAGDREIAELGSAFNEMAAKVEATLDATTQRALTDELSGLPNFRAFSEHLQDELIRADRYPERFGLIVVDIDHFKKYNDAFGHLAGNDALRAVSATIRRTLRTVDFPARYGGEEFVAILPQVDEEGMRVIGERVRQAVESLPPIEGRRAITISIGGALFPSDGKTSEELFAAADTRLYEAKESGRNRVVVPAPSRITERS
ncbi:MAG: diguanylate cyclase [Acidobacteria bacterium]|nr:diguanylate cyclase [Acidobacteriota bacterium]